MVCSRSFFFAADKILVAAINKVYPFLAFTHIIIMFYSNRFRDFKNLSIVFMLGIDYLDWELVYHSHKVITY